MRCWGQVTQQQRQKDAAGEASKGKQRVEDMEKSQGLAEDELTKL